jgi:hypothetical protein
LGGGAHLASVPEASDRAVGPASGPKAHEICERAGGPRA